MTTKSKLVHIVLHRSWLPQLVGATFNTNDGQKYEFAKFEENEDGTYGLFFKRVGQSDPIDNPVKYQFIVSGGRYIH
jgi:hypothetical protein